MAIIVSVTAPNGAALNYHALAKGEVDFQEGGAAINVRVASWPSEADCLAGLNPIWNYHLAVPLLALQMDDFTASIERALIALDGSPMQGGSIIAAASDLETAKVRRWVLIKQAREAHEFGLLLWDGSQFDADARAQARIQGAVQMATLAAAAGEAFALEWTLADNTVRTLSAADMVALGQALAQQVLAAHETARALRLQIEAAASIEEVEAVAWPT